MMVRLGDGQTHVIERAARRADVTDIGARSRQACLNSGARTAVPTTPVRATRLASAVRLARVLFLVLPLSPLLFLVLLVLLGVHVCGAELRPGRQRGQGQPEQPLRHGSPAEKPGQCSREAIERGVFMVGLPEPSGDGLGLRAKIGGERRFAMAGRSYEDCTLLATGTGDEDIVRVIRDPVNGANASGERIPHRSRIADLP
jgi:hypothetical protein